MGYQRGREIDKSPSRNRAPGGANTGFHHRQGCERPAWARFMLFTAFSSAASPAAPNRAAMIRLGWRRRRVDQDRSDIRRTCWLANGEGDGREDNVGDYEGLWRRSCSKGESAHIRRLRALPSSSAKLPPDRWESFVPPEFCLPREISSPRNIGYRFDQALTRLQPATANHLKRQGSR